MKFNLYTLLLQVIFIAIILLCIFYYVNIENFQSKDKYKMHDYSYLYPTRDLGNECQSDNLEPSYMPKICVIDGEIEEDANCKCQDKNTGECKLCYPVIPRKIQEREERIIYNANVL